jgi:hypothetical protein
MDEVSMKSATELSLIRWWEEEQYKIRLWEEQSTIYRWEDLSTATLLSRPISVGGATVSCRLFSSSFPGKANLF